MGGVIQEIFPLKEKLKPQALPSGQGSEGCRLLVPPTNSTIEVKVPGPQWGLSFFIWKVG